MEYDPKTPLYNTGDKNSFAYTSAQKRWPVILTQALDDIFRTNNDVSDKEKNIEGKQIVAEIAKLKYELQHNRKLTPLPDDGWQDIAGYNEELEALGTPPWHNAPWLFAECYLYRRLATLFNLSTHWKSYDVFRRQKQDTFKSSLPAILELAHKYQEIVSEIESGKDNPEGEEILFMEMMEICLWGNATDLSLLTSLSYDDIQKLQGAEARKKAEQNILVNDLPQVYAILKAQKLSRPSGDRRVDIVLDNSGFELFVDLILAGYLLSSNLASTVVLHPKSVPWFVSDVLPMDFQDLLQALADPASFFGSQDGPKQFSTVQIEALRNLFSNLSTHHAEGRLMLRPNKFWTTAHSFHRLPHVEPDLKRDLDESELVIFKGDLNYRKLTADADWPATTPFVDAIGDMRNGCRVLALRTCKADVVVGLPEGVDEKLRAESNSDKAKREWAWSGKWAVVQFCNGKPE